MLFDVSHKARRVWDEWNLRVTVLCSLFFQLLLVILANRRKRGGRVIGGIIWSCYLLADWIAAFAIGLISSGLSNDCPGKAAVNSKLAAFWAPFLLLHLGGPDAITAFSLEDNELWIRHSMGLAVQILSVVYVFLQSLANEYWVPTVLVFFAGACKYGERTVALYKACLRNFKRSLLTKPDPGPNYAQLMEDFSELKASHVLVTMEIVNETEKGSATIDGEKTSSRTEQFQGPLRIVHEGYRFFETFKGLVVDHMFSFHERDESRRFFFSSTAADAFQVMEVELNFLYDVLYTKMALVHCKIGYLCRFLCTILVVACFQQFAALPQAQRNILLFDKIVTYLLLFGAVALDMVGLLNLVLSDWALVSAKQVVSKVLLRLRLEICGSRWSNTMAQHSFISFCLKEERFRWLNKIAHFFRVKESLDKLQFKEETCHDVLKEFVFNELKAKALKAATTKDAKEIYSARGEYVLSDYPIHYSYPSIEASLSDKAEYDESLLMWHIATELCFFTDSKTNEQDPIRIKDESSRMEFCKLLSDYMLYLLVMRPTLMSTVAGIAQIRFQDTCAEANRFFKRWQSEFTTTSPREKACKMLLDVNTEVKPNQVRGDRSKSLLFDACILAKDLGKLCKVKRWEIMSRIWVELVSYAATRCRPSDHARQLPQGGEFITFVWLLMVHFGLAEQFRIEAGDATAKLLVGKR